jgi:hydrogenase maturation protease
MKKPEMLDQIVNAVLYEGYILYPYRPSSKKNQQRFTFGRVYPQAYSIAQKGAEPFVMQTECLLRCHAQAPSLEVSVRFLHPMLRNVGSISPMARVVSDDLMPPSFKLVPELCVDGNLFQTWREAVEREVNPPAMLLHSLPPHLINFPFYFSSSRAYETICNQKNQGVGGIFRRQHELSGVVEIAAEPVGADVLLITVRILNHTVMRDAEMDDQDEILLRSFASAHTILRAQGAEFVSLTDPPADCQQAAAVCRNTGTWPVLVGDETTGERDTMLSSPIILCDYPKIAAESTGTFFDGTEIDEMLSLRIMTMTDEEKREMRQVDDHARRLLERTDTLGRDHMLKMHGVMKPAQSFDENIFGTSTRLEGVSLGDVYLRAGDCVRIRPKSRADLMDMALAGKTAIIEAVEQDAESRVHLALVLQDDPGRDLGMLRQSGHRFFYGLDEVELLEEAK